MKIVIKYILINIKEKKLRSLLIIIAVLSSATLFYLANNISDNFKENYESKIRSSVGSSDFIITSSVNSDSKFIDADKLDSIKPKLEYVIETVNVYGEFNKETIDMTKVNILGISSHDLQELNPIILTNDNEVKLKENYAVISNKYSQELGLKINDEFTISVNNNDYKLIVKGIAETQGYFAGETNTMTVIVDKEFVKDIYGISEGATTVFVKEDTAEDKKELLNEITGIYSKDSVLESISDEEFKQATVQVDLSFKIILVMILILSVFIIYTAFKVITLERMPVIGTIRSIGATKAKTMYVLLCESFIYGCLGGVGGVVFGVIISTFVKLLSSTTASTKFIDVYKVNWVISIITFLLAVSLSLISSFLPILRVTRIPLKDIMLNKLESQRSDSNLKDLIAITCLLLGIICNLIDFGKWNLKFQVLSIILIYIVFILMLSRIFLLFSLFFTGIGKIFSSNVLPLANKTIKDNITMMNNMKLLVISISSLMIISVAVDGMLSGMLSAYDIQNYTGYVISATNNEDMKERIDSVNGILDTYGQYQAENINVENKQENIRRIEGITSDKFLDYINLEMDNESDFYTELKKDRNILLSYELKDILSAEINDKLSLDFGNGTKQYTVKGFFKSNYIYLGSYALIADKYFIEDSNINNYTTILFKEKKDSNITANQIQTKFDDNVEVSFTDERKEAELAEIKQLSDMMKIFTLFTFCLGAFGIFNNFLVSFMERKHSFAIFTSIGMSKRYKVNLVIWEAAIMGFTGSLLGSSLCIIIMIIIQRLLISLKLSMPITIDTKTVLCNVGMGVFISILASIGVIMKSTKLSLVQELKNE